MTVCAYLDVLNPWIAWLVYRGEMVSAAASHESALSVWHTYYLLRTFDDGVACDYYRRELQMEMVRQSRFPGRISRLTGLYFFESVQSAECASVKWGRNFASEDLAEVQLRGSPRISRYDSNWITAIEEHRDVSWISRYFSGEAMSAEPIWELLVEGRGLVFGTEVRARAYETVKKRWPRSLSLLEIARLGCWLDSDLGLITPLVIRNQNRVRIQLHLNFVDATNPDFLRRLEAYRGPRNYADIRACPEWVVPDLTDHTAEFGA